MSEVPSQAEKEFNDGVVVPLVERDYHSCVVIIQRSEKHLTEVYHMTDTVDDAIDMVISGHIVLHEIRRDSVPPDDESDPGDEN